MSDSERTGFANEERRLRSELAQLVSRFSWVRGTLLHRERVCGKPTCRCARGEAHPATYLVASDHGKPHQLFIPRRLVHTTEEWVANYHRIRELLEELSELQRERLRRREP